MSSLAKFEAVVRGNFFPIAIFCGSEMSDFILLDIAQEDELSEAMERELRTRRGLTFVGVAALDKNGKPRTALNLPLDTEAIATLAQAYLQFVGTSIEAFEARYLNKATRHANA